MRDGIAALINTQPDMEVCGEAADTPETLRKIHSGIEVDIVTIDISLRGIDGLELIRNLKALRPNLSLAALSAHDESLYAERAIRAGASGYIMKNQDQGGLIEGIRQILEGKVYVSAQVMARLASAPQAQNTPDKDSTHDLLTNRELEVMRLIGSGFTAQEIADQLSMSAKTVQRHRDNIRQKLGLENNTKLQFYAVRWVYENE